MIVRLVKLIYRYGHKISASLFCVRLTRMIVNIVKNEGGPHATSSKKST